MVLESNSLLSSQHILADKTMSSTWKKQQSADDQFNIFAMLEQSNTRTVMAFYSTNYKTLTLPLRKGILFNTQNSNEAIVGDEILTTVKEGVEYFRFNDTDYEVIATFGVSENSPLKKHVLINDDTLIELSSTQLVFDGKNIETMQWLKGSLMENKGVERWFNIDFLLILIATTTWIVIVCSTILAAYSLLIAREEIRLIQFQIGLGVERILKKDLLLISGIYISLTALSYLFFSVTQGISTREIILSYLVIYLILVGAYARLFINQLYEEKSYVLSN